MCEILADTDEMRSYDDHVQKTKFHAEILRACQCLDERLQNWFKESGPLTEFHDSNGISINPAGPSNLLLAHMTILYWTAYVVLYSTLISIHDPPLSEVPAEISIAPYLRGVATHFRTSGVRVPDCVARTWRLRHGASVYISFTGHHIAIPRRLLFCNNLH